MAYQHTPGASKGNAFCWETYPTVIDWRDRGNSISAAQTQRVEEQRATGRDLLHIHGMGSATRHDPALAARLAIKTAKEVRRGR
jgi:hypothetical protein